MKTGSPRHAYGEALVELGRASRRVVVLDADLARSTQTIKFKDVFPDRFFDMGIAEADMVNTAAGLAASGKIAFCSSFAIFVTGKAWEQIRNTAAYSGLNVKIVASHSGVSVGPDGASHQAVEDIALMRAIPEMTVIAPADAAATRRIVHALARRPGVAYVRLARQEVPTIYDDGCRLTIGRANELRRGPDATIIATGTMVGFALEAADRLADAGTQVTVLDMHTVKPLDAAAVVRAARRTGAIVTCEEHSIIGGLGSAVAEVLGEQAPCPLRRIGIRDRFGESGSPPELYAAFHLTATDIAGAVRDLLAARR